MADVSVRPARTADVGEIARIQIETWRVGYAQILPAAVLESLSVERVSPVWLAAVTQPPGPRHHVLVALEADWTAGFVAFGPADPDEERSDPSTTVMIASLLVEPRWGRRGHGSRLLAAAIDHAREDGVSHALIWVPESDQASRAFFTSAGWGEDGLIRGLDTGAGEIREIRLHTSLEADQSA